jgi:transcriptional regulator with XRE-family HTH domain
MYGNQKTTEQVRQLRKQGGKWLKELREKAGLSQPELADRLGMEYYSFISQLENGRGRIPQERYAQWAAILGMPPRTFVREIIKFYDPVTHELLFGAGEDAAPAADDARNSRPFQELEHRLAELERLLGRKTAEYERLKETLAKAS